jgi:hypothetical protein
LAINRALPILPKIAASIDVVVVESLYSCYDGPDQGYVKVDDDTRNLLLEQLAAGLAVAPGLLVLTLDYADADPTSLGRDAMAFARERGFVPYVSDYRLNQIDLRTSRD